MQLMDMQGRCCGHYEGDAPEGFWLRADDAPSTISRAAFYDRVGEERFLAMWAAVLAQPSLAFGFFRMMAMGPVEITEAFPTLVAFEAAGTIPAGSAIAIWSETD